METQSRVMSVYLLMSLGYKFNISNIAIELETSESSIIRDIKDIRKAFNGYTINDMKLPKYEIIEDKKNNKYVIREVPNQPFITTLGTSAKFRVLMIYRILEELGPIKKTTLLEIFHRSQDTIERSISNINAALDNCMIFDISKPHNKIEIDRKTGEYKFVDE